MKLLIWITQSSLYANANVINIDSLTNNNRYIAANENTSSTINQDEDDDRVYL